MEFFEFDGEFSEAFAPTAGRRNGRRRSTRHEVDLFFQDLTGERPSMAMPPPPAMPEFAPPPVSSALASPGRAWAQRIFDEIAQQGASPGRTVPGTSPGSTWTIVAAPASNTQAADVRSGDLVVKRSLGDARLVSLLVVGATIDAHEIFGPDGRVRSDTLVLRADTGAPEAPLSMPGERWYVEDDAEVVPTFSVGAADAVDASPQFIELPAQVEAWVPNAAGTGIVLAQFNCRTMAELTATMPSAPGRIATPRTFWRANATGQLEALLEVLVFHPATAAGGTTLPAGRHPLAIICHGNHGVVSSAGAEIMSHHGYSGRVGAGTYLQEALAANGIISVSVNMNPANCLNLLLETRAKLAIAALRKMQRLDVTSGQRYHRKIDFQRVALIGHSRGGDAVARAMSLTPSNTRVRAVVQIAPTDSTGIVQGSAPTTLPIPLGAPAPTFTTKPMTIPASNGPRQLIIWGSRDGDVSGLQDVRADRSVNPFRHYDRSSIERAFQFWHGATHNRFNRLWTDTEEDDLPLCLSRIAADPAGLLPRADQEARTIEMVRGWLLFTFYDEVAEARKFDGRTATAVNPARQITGMWKFGRRLATIDQFDDVRPDRNTLGGANVTPSTGVFDEITVANENATGAGVTAYQLPHIDRALRYSPTPGIAPFNPSGISGLPAPGAPVAPVAAPVWRTTIPAGSRDFRRFDVLTFRTTKKYNPTWLNPPAGASPPPPAPTLPTVLVRLIGPTATVRHTTTAIARLSSLPILRLLPAIPACPPPGSPPPSGPCCRRGPSGPFDLTKVHYETWEVDLSAYAAAMSIANVHFVEIAVDTQVGQPVYVDTVSLVKRS